MSREGFQVALARLVADPQLVAAARLGDERWLTEVRRGLDLGLVDVARLATMAVDDRMEVLCSLYRSNRLTALVRTVPEVVAVLGAQLDEMVSEFWRTTPRTDLQFLSEGKDFCRFLSERSVEPAVRAVAAAAAEDLAARYSAGDPVTSAR